MERLLPASTSPSGHTVSTLQTLSVRRIVQMLFMGAAEGGQDEYLEVPLYYSKE